MFDQTRDFWRRWIGHSTYTGRWREAVDRSAMTLKLMTYAPTGALVAAPTAGLPEQVAASATGTTASPGFGTRRSPCTPCCGLGFTDEAAAFWWLAIASARPRREPAAADHVPDRRLPGPRRGMLDHLEGYRGSAPVRIGNGAAGPTAARHLRRGAGLVLLRRQARAASRRTRAGALAGVLDWLCEHWDQPEEGIWETRGGQQPFVYGRLMSWVALDRASASRNARPPRRPEPEGRRTRRDLPADHGPRVGTRNARLRSALRLGGTRRLAAAMPRPRLHRADRPDVAVDAAAMEEELVSDSLVYRYDPKASPDGLPAPRARSRICTFWYVEALACPVGSKTPG